MRARVSAGEDDGSFDADAATASCTHVAAATTVYALASTAAAGGAAVVVAAIH